MLAHSLGFAILSLISLLVLALSTMPYGLAILAGMIWLYSRG